MDAKSGNAVSGVTVGRAVHYVLSEQDAKEISARRLAANMFTDKIPGVQYHQGNPVEAGQHCAMTITAVWNDQGLINGKVHLDGFDDHWVTSRSFDNESKKPFTWHWIEKA